MKHEFNINNLGQRTARKIQQLPPPPFKMNIIHSKDRIYTSKGDKIVPYFPTRNSPRLANGNNGDNKLPTLYGTNALPEHDQHFLNRWNDLTTRVIPYRRDTTSWDKSKFGDGSRYIKNWGPSHTPRQHYGDSTNGNQNPNEQNVDNTWQGT